MAQTPRESLAQARYSPRNPWHGRCTTRAPGLSSRAKSKARAGAQQRPRYLAAGSRQNGGIKVIIKLLTGIGAIGMGALFAVTGCGHSSPPAASAETALAHPIATVDTHSAADSISEARCAREDRCTNV